MAQLAIAVLLLLMLEAAIRIVLLLLVAAISTEGLWSTVVGSTTAGVTLLTSAEGRGPVSTVRQLRPWPVNVESTMRLVLSILHLILMVRRMLWLLEVLLVHHVLRVHLLLHHLLV